MSTVLNEYMMMMMMMIKVNGKPWILGTRSPLTPHTNSDWRGGH